MVLSKFSVYVYIIHVVIVLCLALNQYQPVGPFLGRSETVQVLPLFASEVFN